MHTPVKITFEIQVRGPLHIGTGFRRGLLHRTVARDSESHVYVPGSSLKGKVRNECERLAKLHGLQVCGSALPGLMCGLKPNACIVCRVFGSPARPSSLFWRDAHLADELKKMAKGEGRFGMAEARTQVQMSRLRGVGLEDRLYTTETARPQLTFGSAVEGWLDGVPLDSGNAGITYELLLLLAGLRALDGLGGNRSRGSGDCSVESIVCEIDGHPAPVDLGRIEELMLYADALAEGRAS
jgi:CRISPR/Cas system CSM-associated protein Csm3 (group 7 of RAMP superfamily)